MVRISSLLRRTEAEPTGEPSRDGRIDGPDRPVDGTTFGGTVRDGDRRAYPDGSGTDSPAYPDGPQPDQAERAAARRAAVARAATGVTTAEPRRAGTTDPEPVSEPVSERTLDRDRDGRPDAEPNLTARPTPEPVPVGPRPRASLLATLGLISGVAAALFVLTGTLAGYGIALGATAAVLSVFGMMATRRRHVAGTTDALIGMLVGLGAVVVGVLAMTGQFGWPTTDGDWVLRFREWLDSQFTNRF